MPSATVRGGCPKRWARRFSDYGAGCVRRHRVGGTAPGLLPRVLPGTAASGKSLAGPRREARTVPGGRRCGGPWTRAVRPPRRGSRCSRNKAEVSGSCSFCPSMPGGCLPEAAERRQALRGFVLGVFRFAGLVETALSRLRPGGVDILLDDMSAPPGERFLYFHPSRTRPASSQRAAGGEGGGRHEDGRAVQLDVGGRHVAAALCGGARLCRLAPHVAALERRAGRRAGFHGRAGLVLLRRHPPGRPRKRAGRERIPLPEPVPGLADLAPRGGLSEVRRFLDHLRAAGIADWRAYFESHPEVVRQCVQKVKVLDLNQAGLDLYGAVVPRGTLRWFGRDLQRRNLRLVLRGVGGHGGRQDRLRRGNSYSHPAGRDETRAAALDGGAGQRADAGQGVRRANRHHRAQTGEDAMRVARQAAEASRAALRTGCRHDLQRRVALRGRRPGLFRGRLYLAGYRPTARGAGRHDQGTASTRSSAMSIPRTWRR